MTDIRAETAGGVGAEAPSSAGPAPTGPASRGLTYRGRIELGVALAVLVVGLFFTALALDITPSTRDPVGPRALPLFLALLLVAGAALIAWSGWRDRTPAALLPDDYGFRTSNLARVAQVVGAGAVYVALFFALGYMAATAVAFVLVLAAFGVRSAATALVLAVVAAALYQFVFMGLMGLNDPPGRLVDLRAWSSLVSGR